jgi:predicted RNA-binding protein with TRAM domain
MSARRGALERHSRQRAFEQPVVPGEARVVEHGEFAARGDGEQVDVLGADGLRLR